MIYSCKGCEAPKRYPGCHGVCQEYLEQKTEYDRLKAEYNKKEQLSAAICSERSRKVAKALKGYRGNKVREK